MPLVFNNDTVFRQSDQASEMRLLETTTFELKEFFGSNIPEYAILSHRWDDDEVTFRDVQRHQNPTAGGWAKIRSACAFARERGQSYLWIDTCCIDKSSSAELTEAINSMFKWYQNAVECYAYLRDVPSGLNQAARDTFIGESEWFTRGWTLQELLAPTKLEFVTNEWTDSVDRLDVLRGVIEKATGIKEQDFNLFRRNEVSVARRMSWASRRKCTREEDEAYCLMGLFRVNMPLLYGEGENAFLRLQYEILKVSDDESIFAWWTPEQVPAARATTKTRTYKPPSSILATFPSDFQYSADVRPFSFDEDRRPYSMTNRGVQMEPLLINLREWSANQQRFLGLDGQIDTVLFSKWEQHRLHAIELNCFIDVRSTGQFLQDGDDARMVKNRQRPLLVILRRLADEKNIYCRILAGARSIVNPPTSGHGLSTQRSLIFVRHATTGERGGSASHDWWAPSTASRSSGLLE